MSRSILILLMVGLTTSMFGSNPDTNLNKSQIKGKVQALNEQNALSSAQVVLYGEKSDIVKVATTDQNGDFIINDLPEGEYFLNVSYLGYNTEIVGNIMIKLKGICLNIEDVMLESSRYEIDEVVVKAEKKSAQYISSIEK